MTPLLIGAVAVGVVAFLRTFYSRRITALRETIASRDQQLVELQRTLHLSKVGQLQAKVTKLHPQPRRRITPDQRVILADYARVPEGRQFTIEIIHDMAGSDCSAYANHFRDLLNEIGGWAITRSAVLRPGWMARSGLGIHLRDRNVLSLPETIMLHALAAAGIDYDVVRIPEIEVDVALLITPATTDLPDFGRWNGNWFENFSNAQSAQSETDQRNVS